MTEIGLSICPHCAGTDIACGEFTGIEDNLVTQKRECENCGESWRVEFAPIKVVLQVKDIT